MSWVDACDLQTALSKATSGAQIWVATGTYKPSTADPDPRKATFQLKSGVAIYGGFPATGGIWGQRDWATNLTTLSGDIGTEDVNTDNSYHVVTGNNVDGTAILDGFTISGGNANGASPYNTGGGMVNSSSSNPSLTNVTFTENSATYGGGMYNVSSSPTLTNVTFSTNSATYAGGGMYNSSSSPTLTNVTFSTNSATVSGGGMINYSSRPTLTNVTFSGNLAFQGGGMYNSSSSNPSLTNVTFSTNSATDSGGGMFNVNNSNPTLINVTFSTNLATDSGGGMYNVVSNPKLTNVTFSTNSAYSGGGMYNYSSSPTLTNVTFSGNKAIYGGGMYNDSNSKPTLTNVTFSTNSATDSGGGMYKAKGSSPTLTNAIVWGNTPDQIYTGKTGPATVTYSDIQGGYTGAGNINVLPLLGPLTNNGGFTQTLALLSGSPAIDTANPAFCPTYDQRYYIRPIDGDGVGIAVCDMGAYEYGSTPVVFILTVEKEGSGTVATNPTGPGFIYGEVVTLTATAGPGSTFDSWSGATVTDNKLIITGNTTVTANFSQIDYTLSVAVNPTETGTVTRSPDQTIFHYGDEVTLTPTANSGWTFSSWSGNATVTDNKLTITSNTSVTANFTQNEYTLTVTVAPPGSGTVTRSPDQTTYHYGDEVTLTPVASPGWTFGSWSGNATVTDNKVTITSNTNITANFTQDEYPLTVPETGFSPRHVTELREQPVEKAYAGMDGLWLEIPRLNVLIPIVGVPQVDGEWDVSWLVNQAGWLHGSTFPTLSGNSVLTGHVWDALNLPGPFVGLNTLRYDDQVIIHAWGDEHIYKVRSVKRVLPSDVDAMMKHEESPWLTLVTCQGFDESTDSYRYRVLIRAVLIEVN